MTAYIASRCSPVKIRCAYKIPQCPTSALQKNKKTAFGPSKNDMSPNTVTVTTTKQRKYVFGEGFNKKSGSKLGGVKYIPFFRTMSHVLITCLQGMCPSVDSKRFAGRPRPVTPVNLATRRLDHDSC